MSGRHYNLEYIRITYFADFLADDIRNNDVGTTGPHHPPETLDRLRSAEQIIRVAGKLAKEVERIYSGDTVPEQFNAAFDEVIAEYRRTRFHGHSS